MAIRKYLNWKGWLRGFYLSWIKSITNSLLAYTGSNAIDATGLLPVALTIEQAGGLMLSITFVEILHYLNKNPEPETVENTIENNTHKNEN